MIIKTMIDYVENNLLNEINFSQLEKITYYNKYNLMRIFSACTDYTFGEYVRLRRLSEAGKTLATTTKSVTETAFDYGYTTTESFTKAFKKFNGFTPSECRKTKNFKYIPVWEITKEAIMDYESVEFNNLKMLGFGKRLQGKPENRGATDEKFVTSTRYLQEALRSLRHDDDCDWWELLENFDERGYDFYCLVIPETFNFDFALSANKTQSENYDYKFTGIELKNAVKNFKIKILNGKYAKFTSEYKDFPMQMLDSFTKSVYASINEHKLKRDSARPELLKIHWSKRENISDRHLELFIPVNDSYKLR